MIKLLEDHPGTKSILNDTVGALGWGFKDGRRGIGVGNMSFGQGD